MADLNHPKLEEIRFPETGSFLSKLGYLSQKFKQEVRWVNQICFYNVLDRVIKLCRRFD